MFPGFTTLQFCNKVHDGRSITIQRTNFLHEDLKTKNRNAMLMPHWFFFLQKDSHQDVGHSSDLDQKRSGILLTLTDHKENGTESLNRWWSDSEKADTQFSEPQVHCPEERSKAKEVENYQYTSVPMEIRLKLFFAQLFLFNQRSICGAVSDLCDGYRACQARMGRPVLAGQSDPLFEPARLLMTTPTPLAEVPAQENLLQKYKERVERLSQKNRVIKICTDAGFLTTVEVGQYFMTKDTEEFSQITEPVTCREYTLPRDEKSSGPKGWIRGNTKIGPVLEVTTSYLQGKYGVEIGIESVNKDNSHSWVRISHGLNKLVTDLIDNKKNDNNEQGNLWDEVGRIRVENECTCFCEPIKGWSKNHEDVHLLVHLQELYLSVKYFGLILSQELFRILLSQCQNDWVLFCVMVIYFEKKMERLNSGD